MDPHEQLHKNVDFVCGGAAGAIIKAYNSRHRDSSFSVKHS